MAIEDREDWLRFVKKPRARSGFAWSTLAILAALVLNGCGTSPPPLLKLRVAAASDLQQAMPVLVAAFRQERNVEVDVTFGASGQLTEQIRQGAPFDVLLSANRGFVEKLAEEKVVVPESVKPYARGSLALVINKVSDPKVKSLSDLKRDDIKKIAIANPETAPYGMAAKQALERLKLWDELQPKVVQAESVRQALQFVQSGNAEVGLVGLAISDVPGIRIVIIPSDAYDPIVQSLGVVAGSKVPDEARAFADFMLGETGQGILRTLGFARPPETKGTP